LEFLTKDPINLSDPSDCLFQDELKRELEYSRETAKKVNEEWAVFIQGVKISDLREDLNIWTERLEKNLHAKDQLLQSYIEDIEKIHEMHKRAYHTHTKGIDYLNSKLSKHTYTRTNSYTNSF